jgi:hypothetical protein
MLGATNDPVDNEKLPLQQRINEFNKAVNLFEQGSQAAIEKLLAAMHAEKHSLQQQMGIPESGRYLGLLKNALHHILETDTTDQVNAYRASFNYLLDTAHPETFITSLNRYLETLHILADLEEERFNSEKQANWEALLTRAKINAENEQKLFIRETNRLLKEFIESEKSTATMHTQYETGVKTIKTLQTHMADLYRLVTVDMPAAPSLENQQELATILQRGSDNAHRLIQQDSQTIKDFINHKNQCRKIVNELSDVRCAYLKSEQQRSDEMLQDVGWTVLQTALSIPGVPGSSKVAKAINNALSSSYFNATSVSLAAADTAKTVKETINEQPEKKSSWWQKAKPWLTLGMSILGLAVGVVLIIFPPTTAIGIAATAASFAGMAYTANEIRKTYQAEKARDQAVIGNLDAHEAAIHEYQHSKDALRQERAEQQNTLSSEAKIEMLLGGPGKNNSKNEDTEMLKPAKKEQIKIEQKPTPELIKNFIETPNEDDEPTLRE